MDIDELSENFELLEDWEDKYRYLIDLGRKAAAFCRRMPHRRMESQRLPVAGVAGAVFCAGRKQWSACILSATATPPLCGGLIAVVLTVFDGKTREEILSLDVAAGFCPPGGWRTICRPSRRNGLGAMVEKIRFYASEG